MMTDDSACGAASKTILSRSIGPAMIVGVKSGFGFAGAGGITCWPRLRGGRGTGGGTLCGLVGSKRIKSNKNAARSDLDRAVLRQLPVNSPGCRRSGRW